MTDFLQILLASVILGSLYALIALGYTMVYGILKFINFAHSDIVVLGAWLSFTISVALIPAAGLSLAAPPWWAGGLILALAMLACGGVGFLIERLAYRPLRSAPRLNVLITAIGVSLLLQNTGQLQWDLGGNVKLPFGTQPSPMPRLLGDRVLNDTVIAQGRLVAPADPAATPPSPGARIPTVVGLDSRLELLKDRRYRIEVRPADGRAQESLLDVPAGIYDSGTPVALAFPLPPAALSPGTEFVVRRLARVPIQLVDVVIVVTAVTLMVALQVLVFGTRFGLAMRAASFSTTNASLMGIPVDRVISGTFVIGTMLAAAAGFLYGMKYVTLQQPAHATWVLLGLKAFVAAVVGGIGNIRGAVLGGFLIAFIEQFGALYIDPDLRDVYVFAVLIVVLLVKPTGLLGSSAREKV